MRKTFVLLAALYFVSTAFGAGAAEEKIRGLLEKTIRPGACAQITDVLNDVYYVVKTDEAENAVAPFIGKGQKVVITGTVENREGDPGLYFDLKSAEAYVPKSVSTDQKKSP